MGFFSKRNQFPVNGRTILITGGSQGMGRSVGRLLAEKGANVIIVARTVERLKESIAHISEGAQNKDSQRFTYFSADLCNPSECARVVEASTTWNNGSPPDVVWCCAGNSLPGLFVDQSVEGLKQTMDTNYMSSVYMAHAILKVWLQSPNAPSSPSTSPAGAPKEARHLIFTASFLALFTIAGYSTYSPAKSALRSLAETLSMELLLYPAPTYVPVKTHTIFPATIFGEAFDAEQLIKHDITKKLEEGDEGQEVEDVVKYSVQGLEDGKEMIATTWMTRLVMSSVLGGSRRAGYAVLDTILSWVMALLMPFVRGDLDGKTKAFGLKHNGPGGEK